MLLDDLNEASERIDAFGKIVNNASAQLTSLLNYLEMVSIFEGLNESGSVSPLGVAEATYDPRRPQREYFAVGGGGGIAFPNNSTVRLLKLAQKYGMLNDPKVLKRISDRFGQVEGNYGRATFTPAQFIDFMSDVVRHNRAGAFVQALRDALEKF